MHTRIYHYPTLSVTFGPDAAELVALNTQNRMAKVTPSAINFAIFLFRDDTTLSIQANEERNSVCEGFQRVLILLAEWKLKEDMTIS